jgi:hypothetical protein
LKTKTLGETMSNPLSSIRDSLKSPDVTITQKAKIVIPALLLIAGLITEFVGGGHASLASHLEMIIGGNVAFFSAIALKRSMDQAEVMRGVRKADAIFLSSCFGPGIPAQQERKPLVVNEQPKEYRTTENYLEALSYGNSV